MSYNVDANETYDPTKDRWTVLEPMPSKRGSNGDGESHYPFYWFK